MARPRRWLLRLCVLAAVVALAALLYDWSQTVSPRPAVQALVAAVDEARLRAHVERIAGFGPHPACETDATEAVLAWLEGELRGLGYEPRRETFDAVASRYELRDGKVVLAATIQGQQHNLIAERRGSDAEAPALEVGAHYDSVW